MDQHATAKITFEPHKVIQPIYTGGPVALSEDGQLLATSLGADVLLTNLINGTRLLRVEGDGEAITSLLLTPSASHLVVCSRSLLLRIYALTYNSTNNPNANLLRTLKPHTSPVVTSATDSTGTLLATGGADGVVKVWDIQGGYATHTFHGHSGVISALHFFETKSSSRESESSKKRKRSDLGKANDHIAGDTNLYIQKRFMLASGAEDGKIRIWNLENTKVSKVLNSHVSVVRSLHFDMASNLLLSGSRDKTVILWDAELWKSKYTVPVLEVVENAGFLRSGSLFFTAGETGVIRLWNAQTLQEITQTQPSSNENQRIVDVFYHDKLSLLLSVHADQTFRLHSIATLPELLDSETVLNLPIIRRTSGSHDEVIDLAFCGGTRPLLAVATNVEEVRILSLDTAGAKSEQNLDASIKSPYFGSDVGLLQGHEDIVICLDVDWSGHWLITGAKDNTARLWRVDADNSSFTCFATFTGHTESIGAVALPSISPSSGTAAYTTPLNHPPRFILTGSQDKTIKRWDSSNVNASTKLAARATYTRKAHDKDINAIDVNHDSTLFASASQDRTVKIWSLENGESVGILRGHRRGVWSVKFAPRDISPISGDAGSQASAAKGLVLTGSGDKTLKIWSLTDYSCLRTFEGHTNSVLKVVWMKPSGESHPRHSNQIASAGGDGLVKVWNANSGEVECTLDNHEDRVWALCPGLNTNSLVSGGADSTITFWEDTTHTTAAAAAAASTARVEQDQQLQNYIHAGSYRHAIILALQLNHPARLLSLFTSVVTKSPQERGSLCGDRSVDEVLRTLGDEQLFLLLSRLRDWNTNMKTAPVAQRILWTLLKSYSCARFTNLRNYAGNDGNGMNTKELLNVLRTYTERQYRRMEELIDESYLVEYTLREMDGIGLEGGEVHGASNGFLNGMNDDQA